MALSDDIRTLQDRTLKELSSAHDYHTDTLIAWKMVEDSIAGGRTLSIRNMVTGTTTTQVDLASRARGYIAEQLTEATFQRFVSIFESFFFDLLELWLTAYPQSLGRKMVDFKTVLELPDKDAITQFVVRKELNEVLYDRPTGWFAAVHQ